MQRILATVMLAGCGAVNDPPVIDAPPISACAADNLAACEYASDLAFEVGVADLLLTDPARGDLPVPLRVRFPIGATDPRPVVIWSHGGGAFPEGRTRSEEWGQTFAAAGYIVIHPSRIPIDPAGFGALCSAEGFTTPETCELFIENVVAGPSTAVFALDSLATIESRVPELAGKVDATRVAFGGHSAGSPVPLVLAGAVRKFAGPEHRDGDPRPLAFIATGPHGADYGGFQDGFNEDSFNEIDDRPFLWISGRGDETAPIGDPAHEPSEARTAGWLTSTPGNKLLSWDNDESAVHETMDIHKCDQSDVQAEHCRVFAMLGVAFLDAFVRERPEAAAYVASSDYATLNAGVIELHRR